jgi:hypothetical protein
MSTPHPYPWSEFPAECLLYFAFMGLLHLAALAIGCLICGLVAVRQRGTFLRRVRRLGLFLGLLLVVGSISNGLWSCLVWGRLYFSTDYVFDFSPFWPITRGVIDAPFGEMRGQLLGVSLVQLQLVWLLFAAGTWAVSILLYRLIRRRPPASDVAGAGLGAGGGRTGGKAEIGKAESRKPEDRRQKPEDGGKFTSILCPKGGFLSLSLRQ